jgi:pyrroloquinoline quinone biosynthesis protein D
LTGSEDDVVLELARHYRFQWEPAQNAFVLLYPEGMVKLGGSAG